MRHEKLCTVHRGSIAMSGRVVQVRSSQNDWYPTSGAISSRQMWDTTNLNPPSRRPLLSPKICFSNYIFHFPSTFLLFKPVILPLDISYKKKSNYFADN